MMEQEVSITLAPSRAGGFGVRTSPECIVVGYTEPGCPAELAGVPIGMKITKVNGVAVFDKSGIAEQIKASAARIGGFDPGAVVFTFQHSPAFASMQPQQEAARFDPNTGQPLMQPQEEAARFDPNTGQPLMQPQEEAARFDPNTGQPLMQPRRLDTGAQSQAQARVELERRVEAARQRGQGEAPRQAQAAMFSNHEAQNPVFQQQPTIFVAPSPGGGPFNQPLGGWGRLNPRMQPVNGMSPQLLHKAVLSNVGCCACCKPEVVQKRHYTYM
jgi:hypothetical protein